MTSKIRPELRSDRILYTVRDAAVALLVMLALSITCHGCSSDPRLRYAQALDGYTLAANTARDEIKAGKIHDPATLAAITAVSEEAAASLTEARVRIEAHQPIDANFWVDRLEDATNRLLEYLSRVKERK